MGDIRWELTRHNYGSGADIPGLLRRCAQSDDMESLGELDNLLFHQGGWVCSAATAALPFLTRLAADPGTTHRAVVVDIIADLANEATKVDAEWVDAGWSAAFTSAFPQLVDLLADPDTAVRRGVVRLLTACEGDRGARLAALRARLRAENDPGVRADVVLALGRLSGNRSDLEPLLTEPDPRLRLAAMVGLLADGTESAAEFARPLAAAVDESRHPRWQGAEWEGERSDSLVGWLGWRCVALAADPGDGICRHGAAWWRRSPVWIALLDRGFVGVAVPSG